MLRKKTGRGERKKPGDALVILGAQGTLKWRTGKLQVCYQVKTVVPKRGERRDKHYNEVEKIDPGTG